MEHWRSQAQQTRRRRAAIASSTFTRCPSAVTPNCFKCSSVRLGGTVSSISFSRKAASYFPRPRLRSQTTTSMTASHNRGVAHIICRGEEAVQDRLDCGCLRGSQRPLRSYRQRQCLSVIVKIRSDLEILIFPRRKAPFLSVCACGSFQRTLSMVRPRGNALRLLSAAKSLSGLEKNRRWCGAVFLARSRETFAMVRGSEWSARDREPQTQKTLPFGMPKASGGQR
jgi:hypothetical protein